MIILRSLDGLKPAKASHVCLCMIVKNESKVIRRCLESVIPMINSWCIVDTGSTDDTKEIIINTLRGIPGEIYDRPWVDFATNRNQCLRLARMGLATHYLTIDADEWVEGELNIPAWCEAGNVMIDIGGGRPLPRTVLLSAIHSWEYRGKLHESPFRDGRPAMGKLIEGLVFKTDNSGARHEVEGWAENDLQIMIQEVGANPSSQRMVYLLARMLDARGLTDKADGFFKLCREYCDMIGFKRSEYVS
jgi:glycosyltransferase involved in cell wall biosynthesis